MNRKYTYILIVILVTAVLFYAEKYLDRQNEHYPKTEEQNSKSKDGEFDDSFLPQSTTGVVISHNYFTLSYSEKHEQAEWVAYELTKAHLAKNDFERPYFIQDREVRSGSADWRNYKNSGYDRGHLVPAGDRRFDYNAYHETFLTSNISPQDHDFNGGIWNRLEQKVRFWANKYDGVYVVSGGILEDGLRTIGDERVSIPKEFYKIVVDISEEKPKAIAFIIPNKKSSESFYEYVVTIDQIEKKTGIDFFPQLSDRVEKKLESTINLDVWGKR
ncbi:MAG: DNA/RNA non-specific endonuclease [Flavobacteriaceae bacterium]|nr:DNA/RNA non-specific endonuclease [Flavobacteriaceae bacterium]